MKRHACSLVDCKHSFQNSWLTPPRWRLARRRRARLPAAAAPPPPARTASALGKATVPESAEQKKETHMSTMLARSSVRHVLACASTGFSWSRLEKPVLTMGGGVVSHIHHYGEAPVFVLFRCVGSCSMAVNWDLGCTCTQPMHVSDARSCLYRASVVM